MKNENEKEQKQEKKEEKKMRTKTAQEQNAEWKKTLSPCTHCGRPAKFRLLGVFNFCSNSCERKHIGPAAKKRMSAGASLRYKLVGDTVVSSFSGGTIEKQGGKTRDARILSKAIDKTRRPVKQKFEKDGIVGKKEWN